jgi:hypothetical protein
MNASDKTSAWIKRSFPALNGDRADAARATIRILWVMVALGITMFSIFYCASVSRYWKLSNDSVTYVLGAQSLAAGTGYLEAGHTIFLYPPGTSAMFAVGWLAGRGSYWALNAEVVAFTLGSMAICFLLLRDSMGPLGAATVVLMCLASITLFTWSTFLLSDVFYLFFSLLALWLYSRGSATGIGVSVLAACAMRLIGVSLAGALLVDALRRRPRRWTVAAEMAAAIGFVALWEWRNRRKGWSHIGLMLENDPWVPSHGRLTAAGFLNRFLGNLRHFNLLENLLTNGLTANANLIAKVAIGILLAVICGIGFLALWKRNTAAAIYCILLSLIVAAYHPWIEVRWLLPLLPLLFACLWLGVRSIADRIGNWAVNWAGNWAYVAFAIFAVVYLAAGARFELARIPWERATPFPGERVKLEENYDLQKIAIWWRQHSSPDDKFAADHQGLLQVVTGRTGAHSVESNDPDVLEKELVRERAWYVFVDLSSDRDTAWALPAIEKSADFQLLADEPHARLYHFTPPR